MPRPTRVCIDLQALHANVDRIKQHTPATLMAVIKADAYGHGALAIARSLQSAVEKFAVSSVDEAIELRDSGIQTPILVLEGVFATDEISLAVEHQLELVVHQPQQINWLIASPQAKHLPLWIKVDTGMHRLGFNLMQAQEVLAQLRDANVTTQLQLMSHFASADQPNSALTQTQIRRFDHMRQVLQAEFGAIPASMANSAALLALPNSHFEWVRPGLLLYGVSPFRQKQPIELLPVMTFESQVIAVREIEAGESVGYGHSWTANAKATIVTVAAGYGDGYPRNAKSGTPVLINGQRAKLVGRVSMDMISVDVTDLSNIEIGSHVELWGKSLDVNEVAYWADTIGYELVTRMPPRVPKVYQKGA